MSISKELIKHWANLILKESNEVIVSESPSNLYDDEKLINS